MGTEAQGTDPQPEEGAQAIDDASADTAKREHCGCRALIKDVPGLVPRFLFYFVMWLPESLGMWSRYISTGQRGRGLVISPGLQAGRRSRDMLSIRGHSHSAGPPPGSRTQKCPGFPRLDHTGAKGCQTCAAGNTHHRNGKSPHGAGEHTPQVKPVLCAFLCSLFCALRKVMRRCHQVATEATAHMELGASPLIMDMEGTVKEQEGDPEAGLGQSTEWRERGGKKRAGDKAQ